MVDLIRDQVDELLDELEREGRSGESVGPGVESVAIELYVASGGVGSRWDTAVWDAVTWTTASWAAVGCEVLEADYQSGASQEAGVLSVADAGGLDLRTFDPDRLLDPLATGSPFFGSVRPGTPVRIVGLVPERVPAWSGFIDEARFELASSTGRLRAVDAIAQLAQAELPDGTVLPNTLRARVRAIVAAVGLDELVPVQPDSVTADLLANGSFEVVDTNDPSSGWPVGWSRYPDDGSSWSRSLANPYAVDGRNVHYLGQGDNVDRFVYQQLTGLVPGAVYGFSVYAGYDGSSGRAHLMVDEPGVVNLGKIVLSNTVPLVDHAGYFTAPASGTVQYYLGWELPLVYATNWYFDLARVWGPDPAQQLPPDPPVAPHDGKARSAWSVILDAALDALTFVWLDATGTLRFTPWGSLPDAAYSVGCDDGLGGVWLEGIASLESIAQSEAIRNVVRSWSATDVFGAPVRDDVSVARYGERRIDAARIVPNAASWAQHILDDRADAGLEVTLGELRPYSEAELELLLADAITGPSVVRVRDDGHGELVDLSVGLIGRAVGITPNGWRFRDVAMIPRAEWDQEEPLPPIPPTPPGGTYHQETRSYVATSDALIALTSGGSKYGAGASSSLPVGSWSGWQYRSLVQLPAIPWTKVRRIVSATLILKTSDQVRIGFGSSPTIDCKRITGSWSAGSSSSPSGSNAVVWPGPAVTGSVRANVSKSENASARIRVDGLVLPWAPIGIGGTAAAQRGLALYAGSGSAADTSEFWPVEKGGSSRPSLELVVEVFD